MKKQWKHCLRCKKNTASKNSNVRMTKQDRLVLMSNCAICGKEKSRFMKN